VSDLRRREWVALAALAFAFLISFTFLRATAHIDTTGRTPFVAVPVTPGPSLPSPTPFAPTPTPNPVPAPSGSWLVRFVTVSTGVAEASLAYPSLDFDIPGPPFFYMTDNDWRIEASSTLELEPGQQVLTIEHTGTVTVTVDETEVASSTSSGATRRLTAVFDHPGGRASIRIVATDTEGPFVLRWLNEG